MAAVGAFRRNQSSRTSGAYRLEILFFVFFPLEKKLENFFDSFNTLRLDVHHLEMEIIKYLGYRILFIGLDDNTRKGEKKNSFSTEKKTNGGKR